MHTFKRLLSRTRTESSSANQPTESQETVDSEGNNPQHSNPPRCITPYLNLRSRLSQVWINRWTILLLLVVLRMALLLGQLEDNVVDAKAKALSACTKVEDIGSAMASMPHYLSAGVNSLVVDGMQDAVHGMVEMLDLILQAVPAMIIFYINFLTATYTCLITALVHGSLDVVASVTKDATKAFSDVVDNATKEIQNISSDFESSINKATKGIQGSFLGKSMPSIPTVDFSEPVATLKGFHLNADDFAQDVQKLNKNLPTFEEVQNITSEAVEYPFKLVRKSLNNSYGTWHVKKDVFPLAEKQRLTFCSNNNDLDSFFQKLLNLVHRARAAILTVLSILAAAAIMPMAWLEAYRWRRQQKPVTDADGPMDVAYRVTRPFTSTFGDMLGSRFQGDRKILVRWCVAYATSPPALFVLSLALSGLFSCFCQWLLLKVVERTVPELAGQVGAYAGEVVTSLEKASGTWADEANAVVGGLNDDINKDVLGYVANATDTINSTITTFSNAMQKDLESVFGGTVLLDPIKTVIHCVIGIKIESLQKGLTWVHDHAHVEFPMLDKDVFSKGANASIAGDADLTTFLSSPSSVGTDEVSGAVKHVTDRMRDSLVTETLISVAILLVYFIVVLMGIVRVLAGVASSLRWRLSPRRDAPDGHELAVHDGTTSTERILPQERDSTEPVTDLPLSTAKPPSITDDPPSYGSSMYGNAR